MNYGSFCDRELTRIMGDAGGSIMSIVKVTKRSPTTGRELQDTCALCKAVFENAKCLATRTDCGPNNEKVPFEPNVIFEKADKSNCVLNPKYLDGDQEFKNGASPKWTLENKNTQDVTKTWTDGGTGWMGWSAIYFAPTEVLCHTVSNHVVCKEFVNMLRKKICVDDMQDESYHSRARDLIAAIDFGMNGISKEGTLCFFFSVSHVSTFTKKEKKKELCDSSPERMCL